MGSSPTVQRNKDAKDDDYYILWVSFKKKKKTVKWYPANSEY